jgi:putative addiction module component (TIGR02574 family)
MSSLGIDHLSASQRLALAQELLASLNAEDPASPISEEIRMELRRRVADHIAHPEDVVPWEVVEQELQSRFRK